MNTVSTIGQTMAMEGRSFYSAPLVHKAPRTEVPNAMTLPTSAAEVSQTIEQNLAEAKKTVQEIQKVSDIVLGHKLQFNVNEELGKVVIRVVDPATNQVIREIPSEDLQRIQVQMKQAIGVLFDEII